MISRTLKNNSHHFFPGCEISYIEDGDCDGINNNIDCAYDGGDCCQENICHSCHGVNCKCHISGVDMCQPFCVYEIKGDSLCDGFNNNLECDYDNFDCCRENSCDYCEGDSCICHTSGIAMCN